MEACHREKHVRELEPWETYLSKETCREVVKESNLLKKTALRGTLALATWLPGPQLPLASWPPAT